MNSADHRLSAQLMAVEIISQILVSAKPHDLGDQLTEQLRELTGARTSMLLSRNKETDKYELLSVSPKRRSTLFVADELNSLCSVSVPDSLPPLVKAIPHNNPIKPVLERAGMESILRYPLLAGLERVGILLLFDMPEISRVHEVSEIMNLIAPPIALALKNSLAYRRIEQQTEALDRRIAERSAELIKKHAELQRLENLYRATLQTAMEGFWLVDSHDRIIDVNDAYCHMSGYSREELLGAHVGQLDSSFSQGDFVARRDRLIKLGSDRFESRHRRKEGSIFFVEVSVNYVSVEEGFFSVFISDITKRRNALLELEKREKKYRLLAESTLSVSWEYDVVNDRWTYVAPQAEQIFGFHPSEWTDFAWWVDKLHPEDREWVPRYCREQISRGKDHVIECRMAAKDGATLWVRDVVSVEMCNGYPSMMRGILLDVTASRQAEEKNRYLADIIERSKNEIYVFDSETLKFIYVNRSALDNLGLSGEEMAGMTPLDIKPEMTGESFRATVKPLLDGTIDNYHFQTIHRRADGSDYPVDVNLQLVDDRGQRVFLAIINDISEQKLLESQLQQAQKMESIGRLAGGVAHDFNNMLSVILCHAEMGLLHLDPTDPLAADLEEIKVAAQRSADLTRQLLAFARKQTVDPKVMDLNDSVGAMLKMLQRLIGEDVRLHWNPAAKLWKVKMDPSQLDQILANLCVNARDAIEGVGAITIGSENITVDGHYCGFHPDAVPGDFVRISVSDTGKGMDRETISHIFEPFFTTKDIGQGTGLGLATVYGSVRQNGGFVTVYSEVGKGTTFSVHIPRHTDEVEEENGTTPYSAPPGGNETILVVEDETAILEVSTLILKAQGYTVMGASTPREALRIARSHVGPMHLLITDVIMPQMNGKELFEILSASIPGLKGLYMSGYTADIIARHGVLDEGVHFIQKPFTLESLSRKVREVLDK
jgi:PAS domain S-box-containing protein